MLIYDVRFCESFKLCVNFYALQCEKIKDFSEKNIPELQNRNNYLLINWINILNMNLKREFEEYFNY
jgi:hypothetical protein